MSVPPAATEAQEAVAEAFRKYREHPVRERIASLLREADCAEIEESVKADCGEPGINHEVTVILGNQEPMFLDGLDLLRIVSYVVLNLLYGPSPTEGGES